MLEEIKRSEWMPYFTEFNARNRKRPTRLEVIGEPDAARTRSPLEVESDYWIENGLALSGVSLEPEGEGAPRVEIMLGSETADPSNHMTHTVSRAQRVMRKLGVGGCERELQIEDEDGAVTILHF